MADRPILFSAPMVRALLAGTKTQTRRVFKTRNGGVWPNQNDRPGMQQILRNCPYGQPGDRLRVKEAAWMWCERRPNGQTKTGREKWLYAPMREAPVHYAADHPQRPAIGVVSPDTGNQWSWRLKIGRFLPSWASRITLEVTGVRVERLQDISQDDARAEGAPPSHPSIDAVSREFGYPDFPRSWYAQLWEQINGPDSWAANPWVWCVEFRRVMP